MSHCNLAVGIVGLPNVGKSTIFNALVKSELAEAANYAFTTIDPNVGVVEVPDERLKKLAEIEKSDRIVPATVKFVDIAGLIAGAHKGEGLGNKFLSHIREVDAIAMVVRLFKNKDVMHVSDKMDPKDDIETIMLELVLSDSETLGKKLFAVEKDARSGSKIATQQLEIYKKIEKCFSLNQPAIEADLTEEEKDLVDEANFLTLKPFLYVFNVDEDKATKHPEDLIEEYGLKDLVQPEHLPAVPSAQPMQAGAVVISAKIESELPKLSTTEQEIFLKDLGLDEPGLNRLAKAAYKTLNLIPFFTAGPMEARAWTVKRGDKAPQAAGKIHTDFENKFIKAEVVNYADFINLGGWTKAKEVGKARLEGKTYEIKDGDVVFIHHG